MKSTPEVHTEGPNCYKCIAKLFGNVAAAIVILGWIFTGQGFMGTVMLVLQLMAAMLVLALCAALVSGGRKRGLRKQASAVISPLLCLAAVVLVAVHWANA